MKQLALQLNNEGLTPLLLACKEYHDAAEGRGDDGNDDGDNDDSDDDDSDEDDDDEHPGCRVVHTTSKVPLREVSVCLYVVQFFKKIFLNQSPLIGILTRIICSLIDD